MLAKRGCFAAMCQHGCFALNEDQEEPACSVNTLPKGPEMNSQMLTLSDGYKQKRSI